MRQCHVLKPTSRSGFTIVELLVTIGVMGVLIGILTPVLLSARAAAGETKSMSNLRGLGLVFSYYSEANRGKFPFYHEGDLLYMAPPHEPDAPMGSFSPHWSIANLWPMLMHNVAPWEEYFESWLSPGRSMPDPPWPIAIGHSVYDDSRVRPVSYVYSNSFIAKPVVWSGAEMVPASSVSPVFVSEVASPSLKVLAYDTDRAYRRSLSASTLRPVLFVDGSVSLRSDDVAMTPVQNALYWARPRVYHDTPDGVLGRDF